MNTPLKLHIILGSTRDARFSEHAGAWAKAIADKNPAFVVEMLDLRDYPMPFFDQAVTPSAMKEPYALPIVQAWTKKISEADAFLIVAPEYNRSVTGVLKNAIDWVNTGWHKKPVSYVAYGSTGGSRAVDALRTIAIELQMAPVRNAVHISAPWALREDNGSLKAGALDSYERALDSVLEQLAAWGTALRDMRANDA
jgi:NAD(P)H-dependent FMN reductase